MESGQTVITIKIILYFTECEENINARVSAHCELCF